jgi:hypothetical protein
MKEAKDVVDRWFGRPAIPKHIDKMLEGMAKFRGDGTDKMMIAEMVSFIEESASQRRRNRFNSRSLTRRAGESFPVVEDCR